MIKYASRGEWKKTRNWLSKVMRHNPYNSTLQKYGKRGVEALKNNTPVSTGITAESWFYEITEEKKGVYKITWCNSNLENEWFNVALYLQLGHATGSGTWVEGIDYINPALAPVFNNMAEKVWEEFSTNE